MHPCSNCGFINPDDADFCESCGLSIEIMIDTTETFEAIKVETAEESEQIKEMEVAGPALFVTKGPNEGEAYPLQKSGMSIGRDPKSDIFLDDITVSRKHAQITYENGQYIMTDTGSLNGTYVNQDRIEKSPIRRGDEIQIGKYRLAYLTGAERRRNI